MTVCICWTAEETNQKSLERLAQRAGKEAVQWGRNRIEPFLKTLKKIVYACEHNFWSVSTW